MDCDLLDLYERASVWTGTKVRGAVAQLDAPTTCEPWNVRTLLNHMLQIQRYFVGVARGDDITLHFRTTRQLFSAAIRVRTLIRPAPRRFAPLDSQASSRRRGQFSGTCLATS